MTEEQLNIKIAYLVQENNRLREAILDYQIKAGEIGFKAEESETVSE